MGAVYVTACLIVIIVNIGQVPEAFGAILAGAFRPEGMAGGVLGVIFAASVTDSSTGYALTAAPGIVNQWAVPGRSDEIYGRLSGGVNFDLGRTISLSADLTYAAVVTVAPQPVAV